MRMLSTFNDWFVYERGGYYYIADEYSLKLYQVELVEEFDVLEATEEEIDKIHKNCYTDYSGELDNECIICYWRVVDES